MLSKVGLDNMPSIFEPGSIDFKDLFKKKKKTFKPTKIIYYPYPDIDNDFDFCFWCGCDYDDGGYGYDYE